MPKGEGYGSSNPTTSYLLKGKGRGTSSVVKGGGGKNFMGGIKEGEKSIGTKRYDVTSKSLNRGSRGMR